MSSPTSPEEGKRNASKDDNKGAILNVRFGINLRMLTQVAQPECFGFSVIKRLLGSDYENERPGLCVV